MQVALTDRFCERAKPHNGHRTDYFDELADGLALRVSARGRKSWTFNFTSPRDGKRARLTFGTYPATSLGAARTRALEAKGHVEAGSDPRDVSAAELAGAMTVAILVEKYLANHVEINLRTAAAVKRRLNKNIVPVIGHVRLSELHRRDVNRVVEPILKRDAPLEATRAFEDLRAMVRWAVARGDLDLNPIDGMKKPASSKPRERVLADDEINTLWNGLPEVLAKSVTCQRIIRLCLVTAQRVGEVAGMRRDELDLKRRVWSLPGSRTKNGHPHHVPLSELATDAIEEALEAAGAGAEFVFPSDDGPMPAHAVAKTITRAQARFGLAHWTAHDLRRTALTQMAQLGIPPIVLGHIANHRTTTKAGVTLTVYSHYDYAKEKREALELWAIRLVGVIADAGEIVPIQQEAA